MVGNFSIWPLHHSNDLRRPSDKKLNNIILLLMLTRLLPWNRAMIHGVLSKTRLQHSSELLTVNILKLTQLYFGNILCKTPLGESGRVKQITIRSSILQERKQVARVNNKFMKFLINTGDPQGYVVYLRCDTHFTQMPKEQKVQMCVYCTNLVIIRSYGIRLQKQFFNFSL